MTPSSLLLLLLACGGEPDAEGDTAPSDSAPASDSGTSGGTDTGPCAGVPVLTWDTFGHGFLLENCDGCHAAEARERYDAPEEVVFDTVDQAWAWADRILVRAAGADPTMPPNGGVPEDDRQRLAWWLGCGEPGT